MKRTEHATQRFAQIAAEHRNSKQRASQLLQLVRRPIEESPLPTALSELPTHLRDLSKLMRRHIAWETAGGYLDEAVARVPRLAGDADVIERQHADLRRDVAVLVDISKYATSSLDIWKQMGGAVAQFVGKLLPHETEESRIL